MPQNYLYQIGQDAELSACIRLSGPIPASEVPEPVRILLDDPLRKVTQVIVVHRDMNTNDNPKDGFVWVWSKIGEEVKPWNDLERVADLGPRVPASAIEGLVE